MTLIDSGRKLVQSEDDEGNELRLMMRKKLLENRFAKRLST